MQETFLPGAQAKYLLFDFSDQSFNILISSFRCWEIIDCDVLESFVSVGVSLTIYKLEVEKYVKRIQVDTGAEIVLKKSFGWAELSSNTVSGTSATGAQKGDSSVDKKAGKHEYCNGHDCKWLVEELRQWREDEFPKITDQDCGADLPLQKVELLFITEPKQFLGLVLQKEFLVFDDLLVAKT